MTLLLRSLARRIPSTTIVVGILALLLTQAASFVCGAQCLQHQQAGSAMAHCHGMQQPSKGLAAQTCPSATFCVTDLLADSQQRNTLQTTIQAGAHTAVLLPVSTVAARTTVSQPRRSTIGDPPLLTPLRV